MVNKKYLNEMNIIKPNERELEIIISLLEKKMKLYPKTKFVIVQEFHPDAGGYHNNIETLEVAKMHYGQRKSAPFVLTYLTIDYYKDLEEQRIKVIT